MSINLIDYKEALGIATHDLENSIKMHKKTDNLSSSIALIISKNNYNMITPEYIAFGEISNAMGKDLFTNGYIAGCAATKRIIDAHSKAILSVKKE